MTVDISRAPFPVAYRELWLPRAINGNASLPSSRHNGHDLTLTGARKGTTTNGGRFRGGVTDNLVIAAHGDQQNKAAFHITIRFRFPEGYTVGDGDVFLFNWDNGGFDYIRLRFETADGKIYFEQGDAAAGQEFQLVGTLTTWVAGQWYTVTARLQDTPEQELYEDGVSVDSSSVATPIDTPAGADIIIGSSSDGGADGARVVISFVLIGVGATATVAVDDADVAVLAKGFPPATAKVQYFFPMDEGRGVTVTNRGDATGDGTLDTGVAWIYGPVEQIVLSFDAVNDIARAGAGVDISGDITLVWVGKMKSTYDSIVRHRFVQLRIDADDDINLWYNNTNDKIGFIVFGGGVSVAAYYDSKPAIDDYWIMIATYTASGRIEFFVNGISVDVDTGGGIVSTTPTVTADIGGNFAAGGLEISKPLFVALIDGAFTAKQALAYSRWLKNIFNLPVVI